MMLDTLFMERLQRDIYEPRCSVSHTTNHTEHFKTMPLETSFKGQSVSPAS